MSQVHKTRRFFRRNRRFYEALENRLLLTVTFVHDTGDMVTNGNNLQTAINAAALGDTIVLDANATYLNPTGGGGFTLPYKTGSGTLTIESSEVYNNTGHLAAGVRVTSASAQYMPHMLSRGGNAPVFSTVLKDSAGNIVTTGAHNYALIGLEIAPEDAADGFQSLVILGDGTSNQSTIAAEAHDLVIDRCYIHGLDPISATIYANLQKGITLNSYNTTIENCEISNIHTDTPDGQAIGGSNGSGNDLITNNYLEGSSECVLFGGATTYINNNIPTNITITNNHFAKRASWNPYDPAFYGPTNYGIHWNVKNLLEFKNAKNILIDGNYFENSWVGGDQTANAILFTAKNQATNGSNPWVTVANVTFTNNVIRSVGEAIQLAGSPTTDNGYHSTAGHDFLFANNIFEHVDESTDGPGVAFAITRGADDGLRNVTITHNTIYVGQRFMSMGSSYPWPAAVLQNFVVTNNVLQFGQDGIFSSAGTEISALNTFANGITLTNLGVGYTAAPTVTFVGGGGSGATATAQVDTTKGLLKGITILNTGAGYTSAPTIVINGGGATTSATATYDPFGITNGMLQSWIFTNNIIYGAGSNTTKLPAGNFFPTTEDSTFLRDPAGELSGLLPTSIGHNAATDGSDIGVNFPALLADNHQFTPLDASLTGYWKFDEGTGASASDSSGNTNTGTLSGSPLPTWNTTSGQSYDALTFAGTGGYVSIPNFNTSATFSFAAWINPGTITANSYIASAGNGAFSIYLNSSGKLTATTSNGGLVTDAAPLTASTWYLVGITYDSTTNTLTLYKNGNAVATATTTGPIASGATTLYLGDNAGASSSFKGSLDEVRYYNSNMSALTFNGITMMRALYNNFGPLTTGINPGGGNPRTTSSDTLTEGTVTSHYTYAGMTNTGITYTWSILQGPSATFSSSNGTTTGNTTTITYSHAGKYNLQLVVNDSHGGSTTVIGHTLTINQLPVSASISGPATLATGQVQQYNITTTGVDQFGDPLGSGWTWALATGSAGTIDPNTGIYYAPGAAGSATINLKFKGVIVATTAVTTSGAALPVVTVNATDSSTSELWDHIATYTITRTGSTTSPLTVNFAITGTAILTTDYTIDHANSVTIPAGSASATVNVVAVHNNIITGNLSNILTLTAGSGYAIGTGFTSTITVIDNDIPTISITATTNTTTPGGAPGVFTLTQTGAFRGTSALLTANYNLKGTAFNNVDYSRLLYSVVFLPGQTTTTITVNPINTGAAASKTVIAALMTDASYNLASPTSDTVTILPGSTPAAPSNFIAQPGAGYVALSFSAGPPDVTSYTIQRSTNNSTFTNLVTISNTAYHDTATTAGVLYYYRVEATNPTGNSPFTTSASSKNAIPGDVNLDGKVDLTDLTILSGNWQQHGTWTQGDLNGDGNIDLTDLTILAGNWQAVASASAMAPVIPSVITATTTTAVSSDAAVASVTPAIAPVSAPPVSATAPIKSIQLVQVQPSSAPLKSAVQPTHQWRYFSHKSPANPLWLAMQSNI